MFIKASPGRNPINVLGEANAITKEIPTMTNIAYIDANTIVAFLKQLKEKYPDKPIAIVLDNAIYQHCFFVTTWAKSLGIHLLFLPPYLPILIPHVRIGVNLRKTLIMLKPLSGND